MGEGERVAVIDTKLLELIACPISKGPLVYDAARSELISKSARLAYPVRDGIPIMLPSEARSLRDEPPEGHSR
jgi:uncharacterized protein YbaR (Trm112 family)